MKQVCVNASTWSRTASTTRVALLPTVVTAIPDPRSMSELPSTSTTTPPPARSTKPASSWRRRTRLVVALREIADQLTSETGTVITSCGELTVVPNSPVVIAREVAMLLDLRSDDQDLLDTASELLDRQVHAVEAEANVRVENTLLHSWGPRTFSDPGVALSEKVSAGLGLSSRRVRTRAGHDATNMTELVPTVLCFVPSKDGLSHNEHEFTADPDLVAGVQMLTELLRCVVVDGELVVRSVESSGT